MNIYEIADRATQVKNAMACCDENMKNRLLDSVAKVLQHERENIFAANAKDIQKGKENGLSPALLDRLRLDETRLAGMIEGVLQVKELSDPCGKEPERQVLTCGVECERKTVPFGVLLMIYEARPNVTIDAGILGLKAGNALILRGGKEAIESNKVLVACLQTALEKVGLPKDIVQLVEDPNRALVKELIRMRDKIDLVIPRGGASLIHFVVENSTVPVIETGSGICHTYVDRAANLEKAIPIIVNAKVQRPAVCNAMETLLVHKDIAPTFLPKVADALMPYDVELRGDELTCAILPQVVPATDDDWATEYNDLILSIRVVANLDTALAHIAKYGTRHSECIVSEDPDAIATFLDEVDAAAVYANASTRFTDGFEFGLGAEIGISTQKMHVRGPMGLEALVTYKYLLRGDGQIRG